MRRVMMRITSTRAAMKVRRQVVNVIRARRRMGSPLGGAGVEVVIGIVRRRESFQTRLLIVGGLSRRGRERAPPRPPLGFVFFFSACANLVRPSRIWVGVQAAKPKTSAGFSSTLMQK